MTEWEKDEEILAEGYNQLSKIIQTDEGRLIIINTFKNVIDSKEWPEKYYVLRDEYLPGIIGQNASDFVFWYIFNFGIEKEFKQNIKNEDLMFLNYFALNYGMTFIKAKEYNENPMGFNKLLYTFNSSKEDFNMYIYRNDGGKLLLRTDVLDVFSMFSDAFYYLSRMIESSAQYGSYEEKIDTILEHIVTMKQALDLIEETFKEENDKYE